MGSIDFPQLETNINGTFVPYVGAVQNVDLGANNLSLDGILTVGDPANDAANAPYDVRFWSYDAAIAKDSEFFWNAGKSALAVGNLQTGTEHDDGNMGIGSIALGGSGNKASGGNSVAIGKANLATGDDSFSMGISNASQAVNAFALGISNTAVNTNSLVFGKDSKTSANGAIAIGIAQENTVADTIQIGVSSTPLNATGEIEISAGTLAFNTAAGGTTIASGDLILTIGNLTASAGTGTFGQIIDNGLTANLGVYTDGSKQLTSTPPTSGVLGYWSRTGTTISTSTAGDDITTTGQLTADTLTLAGGSITDTTGAISFGNENLTTTGGSMTATAFIAGSTTFRSTQLESSAANLDLFATGATSDLTAQATRDVYVQALTGNLSLTSSNGDIFITAGGTTRMGDNRKLTFGNAEDIQMYFDGTETFVVDLNTVTTTGIAKFNFGSTTYGNVGSYILLGSHAQTYNAEMNITKDLSGYRGVQTNLDLNHGTTPLTNWIDNVWSNLRIAPDTVSSGTITEINNYKAQMSALWSSTANITEWNAYTIFENWNTNYNGIISTLRGYHLPAWTDTSINVTVAAGLDIEDITVGATNYAVRTGKGEIKLGDNTSATKFGIFGQTPVIRQTTTSQTPATFAANTSGIADDTATWGGYTVGDLVAILQAYGFLT
jgi:hypothetical protein